VIEAVAGFDAVRVRAANPGLFTLDGTNTWVLGRDPAWVVDPGPDLEAHLDAVAREVAARGGAGGIAITHGHGDHTDGISGLLERLGAEVPVAAMEAGRADVGLCDGASFGPLEAVHVPGHAADHLCFVWGLACCSGDAVLGHGSVYVAPGPGSLSGYLAGLRRLRERPIDVILPGHGPVVADARAKLDEYVAHRMGREQRLVAALADGIRTESGLLDVVWGDVPALLRPAAAITLAAHLGKLAEEGRLPGDLEVSGETVRLPRDP